MKTGLTGPLELERYWVWLTPKIRVSASLKECDQKNPDVTP
jgi:hypothetical protein